MRSFPIHKNLSLHSWLRRRVRKEKPLRVARIVEKITYDAEILFLISILTIGMLIAFWTFLVFLNVTSF